VGRVCRGPLPGERSRQSFSTYGPRLLLPTRGSETALRAPRHPVCPSKPGATGQLDPHQGFKTSRASQPDAWKVRFLRRLVRETAATLAVGGNRGWIVRERCKSPTRRPRLMGPSRRPSRGRRWGAGSPVIPARDHRAGHGSSRLTRFGAPGEQGFALPLSREAEVLLCIKGRRLESFRGDTSRSRCSSRAHP
jgi:hypothetical protein